MALAFLKWIPSSNLGPKSQFQDLHNAGETARREQVKLAWKVVRGSLLTLRDSGGFVKLSGCQVELLLQTGAVVVLLLFSVQNGDCLVIING